MFNKKIAFKLKQSSFIIIYTLLLAFGNSFTVQRLDEGDIDQEGAPCQGTIIANRDTTFTTVCIILMSEKGCGLIFNDVDNPRKPAFMQYDRTGFKGLQVVKSDKSDFCSGNTSPNVGDIEMQTYPSESTGNVWRDAKNDPKIFRYVVANITDAGILHLDFNAHWPGALFRISIKCVDNEGGVSNDAGNSACVFVKFEGRVTYPLEVIVATATTTRETSPTKPSNRTSTTARSTTALLVNTTQLIKDISTSPPSTLSVSPVTSQPTTTAAITTTITTSLPNTTTATIPVTSKTFTSSTVNVTTTASAKEDTTKGGVLSTDPDNGIGLIVGLVIGILVVAVIILVVLCCFFCRRKKKSKSDDNFIKTEVVKETNVIYKNGTFDDQPDNRNHTSNTPPITPKNKRVITIFNVNVNDPDSLSNDSKDRPTDPQYNIVIPEDVDNTYDVPRNPSSVNHDYATVNKGGAVLEDFI